MVRWLSKFHCKYILVPCFSNLIKECRHIVLNTKIIACNRVNRIIYTHLNTYKPHLVRCFRFLDWQINFKIKKSECFAYSWKFKK